MELLADVWIIHRDTLWVIGWSTLEIVEQLLVEGLELTIRLATSYFENCTLSLPMHVHAVHVRRHLSLAAEATSSSHQRPICYLPSVSRLLLSMLLPSLPVINQLDYHLLVRRMAAIVIALVDALLQEVALLGAPLRGGVDRGLQAHLPDHLTATACSRRWKAVGAKAHEI